MYRGLSRFGTCLQNYGLLRHIRCTALAINPHFALPEMVKAAFTNVDVRSAAFFARRCAYGHTCRAAARQQGGDRNRSDYQAGVSFGRCRPQQRRARGPAIPAARCHAAGRVFLGCDPLEPVFAHLFNKRGALQSQHPGGFGNNAISAGQRRLNTLKLHMLDLGFQVDRCAGIG